MTLPPLTPGVGLVFAIVVAALGVVHIVTAAQAGSVAMVVNDCLNPLEVDEAVQWDVIFLLAGVIPPGIAAIWGVWSARTTSTSASTTSSTRSPNRSTRKSSGVYSAQTSGSRPRCSSTAASALSVSYSTSESAAPVSISTPHSAAGGMTVGGHRGSQRNAYHRASGNYWCGTVG